MSKKIILEKPLFRGHFHQAMFFVSLGACILLLLRTNGQIELLVTMIYCIGLLSMFGISALYHRFNWSEKKRSFMKSLDHAAIYLMIAGTFTPITFLALSEDSGMVLFRNIWIVAGIGIIQSIFLVNIPKILSSLIYLFAGYMVIPYIGELIENMSSYQIFLLVGGGVIYSIGALSYGFKRPVLNPKFFGYHEVFHLLVSIAAIFHFALVYTIIAF